MLVGAAACVPDLGPDPTGRRLPDVSHRGRIVVVAVADIACAPGDDDNACRHGQTDDFRPGGPKGAQVDLAIIPGDLQYDDGQLDEFLGSRAFDATWGRAADAIYAVPGNHEYKDGSADGYFDYWSMKNRSLGQPGSGFYSFEIGDWQVLGLNTSDGPCETGPDCAEDSAQNDWLERALDTTDRSCILAFWHHPLFDSGDDHGNDDSSVILDLWIDLYEARADVVVNGHSHNYQRYAPQTPLGEPADDGIRQFVVGTGGKELDGILDDKDPNFETWQGAFGVLKLDLFRKSFSWRFIAVDGEVLDSGGPVACNGPGGDY